MAHKKKKFNILVLLVSIFLFGCDGGGGNGGQSLPAKTLSWDPPTAYTDDSSLNPATDLENIEIFIKETGSPFTEADSPVTTILAADSASQPISSFNLAALGPVVTRGVTYQVSLRAVTKSGMESDFALPVIFTY